MAQETGDSTALATAWNTMGLLNRKLGRPRMALEAFNKALEELDAGQEIYRPRQVYNNIGVLHADRAEWEEARTNLEKSREIAHRAGDTDGEATALSNLVRVYVALSSPRNAVTAAEQANQLFRDVHNWFAAAVTSRGIARYYRRAQRIDEANAAFVSAADLFTRAGADGEARQAELEREKLYKQPKSWSWPQWMLIAFGVIFLFVIIGLLVS